jgi:hypothetical protein
MNKKIYCTLDTETVGGINKPKGFYHIGGIIHDRQGNIIGCFNYVVAEMLPYVLTDDYAKNNIDLYYDMLENGTATIIDTQENAIAMVGAICDYYNVGTMMAFNSGFDYVKTMCRELIVDREFIDLWLMALETICQKASFKKFCADNGKYKPNKNCLTNAETVFAYLTNNPCYVEEHTALEDSKIELEIFNACIKMHKKFTPNCHCWDYENKWGLFPRIEG